MQNPSTIYIAHEHGARSGGFQTSLNNSGGWTLVNTKSELKTGCCPLEYVWKNVVAANGKTIVTLPETTTKETVHSIFVRGKSLKIILD